MIGHQLAVNTGMQTGLSTTTAPNPSMSTGAQPLGMQQQQGIIGHQLGMNTGMQSGLPEMTPNPSMSPGLQSLGMQQGPFSGMPNNPNRLSGMQSLGMQQGNFPNMSHHQGMQSLGMPQGNVSPMTPNQNLGYPQFPQTTYPYPQQGMQPTSFPQNQNPAQLGFPNQIQPDTSVMELGM